MPATLTDYYESHQVPHRVARRPGVEGHRQGGRPDLQGRASADHRRARRVPSQGLGCAARPSAEKNDLRGHHQRSDARPLSRRSPAVGEPVAARVDERRSARSSSASTACRARASTGSIRMFARFACIPKAATSDATGRSSSASSATSSRSSRRSATACRSASATRGSAEVAAATADLRGGADAQLPERSEVQRRHRRASSVGHRQRAQRLSLQGQDRSEADPHRLGRLLVAAHHGADAPRQSARPGNRVSRISSARSVPTWR